MNVYISFDIAHIFSEARICQRMVRLLQLGHTTRRPSSVQKHSPEDSPAMCRQRRLRRIEMRRTRPNWPPVRTKLPKRRSAEKDEEENSDSDVSAVLPRRWRLFRSPMPLYSEISMTGLSETSHVASGSTWVQEDFCSPDVFSGGEALHFFAVYDGRDSSLYKQLLHRLVAEELGRVDHALRSEKNDHDPGRRRTHRQWWNDHLLFSLRRSFERIMATSSRNDGGGGSRTAAAVAILTAKHIVVTCSGGGACRVVLGSDGVPIPLCQDRQRQYYIKPKGSSYDTKALEEDDDEIGGYEVLQVSRPLENQEVQSLGTTNDVEIFIIERSRDEDECLILATHDVWDVMSDKLACDLTNNYLRNFDTTCTFGDRQRSVNASNDHGHSDGMSPSTTTGIDAATLLCRLAVGRGSSHGISVVIVDLKTHSLL